MGDQLKSDATMKDPALMFVDSMSEEDLAEYPKTILFTAEFDFYRRPAERFAVRLDKAGKLSAFVVHPGVTHDWQLFADYDGVDRFFSDAKNAFAELVA